uniref:ANK_REP_REGION domain-containing protein n=1 Tax=Trichuris muris TaxID=70415 RepID=A0A5S6QGE1_TRIMR
MTVCKVQASPSRMYSRKIFCYAYTPCHYSNTRRCEDTGRRPTQGGICSSYKVHPVAAPTEGYRYPSISSQTWIEDAVEARFCTIASASRNRLAAGRIQFCCVSIGAVASVYSAKNWWRWKNALGNSFALNCEDPVKRGLMALTAKMKLESAVCMDKHDSLRVEGSADLCQGVANAKTDATVTDSSVSGSTEAVKSEEKKSVRLTPAEYFFRSRQRHMKLVDICQSNDGKFELNDLKLSVSSVDNLVEKFREKMKIEADREATEKTEGERCEVPKERNKLPESNEKTCILLPRGPIAVKMGRSVAPSPYSLPEGVRLSKDRNIHQFYPTDYAHQHSQYQCYSLAKSNNFSYVNSDYCLNESDLYPNAYASYAYRSNGNDFVESVPHRFVAAEKSCAYVGNFTDERYLQENAKELVPQQTVDWNEFTMGGALLWQQQFSKSDEQESPFSDSNPSSNHSISTTGESLDLRQTKPLLDSPNSELADSDRENELPDGLCDFILKYSRKYQSQSLGFGREPFPQIARDCKAFVDHSSPLSANSCGDSSPGAPVNTQTASVCASTTSAAEERKVRHPSSGLHQQRQNEPKAKAATQVTACSKNSGTSARQLLRKSIDGKSLENAWAWAIKCELTHPGLLYETDHDGDSMLHIAVWQKNISYIYALTEVMLKTRGKSRPKPFDLLNKWNETPLYFAVVKKMTDVVRYFVEYGAKANVQSKNTGNDSVLHYAASNGLTEILKVLCSGLDVDLNQRNDSGMTPLHSAVKSHAVADEQAQTAPDNLSVVKLLLNSNVDPVCQDSKGKTIIHYCVEKMDVELLQLVFENVDKEVISRLIDAKTVDGMSALELLESTSCRQFSHLSRFGNEQMVKEKLVRMLSQSAAAKSAS